MSLLKGFPRPLVHTCQSCWFFWFSWFMGSSLVPTVTNLKADWLCVACPCARVCVTSQVLIDSQLRRLSSGWWLSVSAVTWTVMTPQQLTRLHGQCPVMNVVTPRGLLGDAFRLLCADSQIYSVSLWPKMCYVYFYVLFFFLLFLQVALSPA